MKCRRTLSYVLISFLAAVLQAQTISLDGDWSFVPDPAGTLTVDRLTSAKDVRISHVPGSWQSQFEDLRDYAGVAWYWRRVDGMRLPADTGIFLHFGAVDYLAEIYVNGKAAGAHEGGYLPFEVDVTPYWRAGANVIALRVTDASGKQNVAGIKYDEIPHGKQNWYVETGGPWQSVWMQVRPRTRLAKVHITARADGSFAIEAPILGPRKSQKLTAEILDPQGRSVWQGKGLATAPGSVKWSGRLSNPSLWSLREPNLYTLQVALSSGDAWSGRFGFRTFEARGGKFYLNDNPVYLRGALDQDFYPETIYTPPSSDSLDSQMRKAKALGLNMLRYHIKVADPRYLEAADRAGILIWYDLPNWDTLTANSKRRGVETMRGTIDRDWNHPSIVIYAVINESWGIDLKDPAQRQWVKETWAEAKRLAPGWLVVDNTPCCDNYHLKTDIADWHQYNAIPDSAGSFEQIVGDLANRARWLFSPHADAESTGQEPLVLSEFGNWGLPQIPDPKPWWFSRSFKNNENTLPAGVEDRFRQYGLSLVFRDLDTLITATQWHQYDSMKYEIETLRWQPSIQGYVITEFTDLNWECNGLLDMWRHPKAYAAALERFQRDDVVLVRARRRNFYTGQRVSADVRIAHYSTEPWLAAPVSWFLEDSSVNGVLDAPPVQPGSVVDAGRIDFVAPAVTAPTPKKLIVRVVGPGGQQIENSLDLFFYPRSILDEPPAISIHDPNGRFSTLIEAMRARNYKEDASASAIVVSSAFDEFTRQALLRGRTVLLLANDRQALAPGIQIALRANSNLDGNWITGFLWARTKTQPFRAIAFKPLAGFEAQRAAPDAVVQGIPPENFDDVLSGLFYGWLHMNAAAMLQARYGAGRLLVATYQLPENYGADPYSTILLDELLAYAKGSFAPQFDLAARPTSRSQSK